MKTFFFCRPSSNLACIKEEKVVEEKDTGGNERQLEIFLNKILESNYMKL